MLNIISEVLNKEMITRIGMIDIEHCDVINQRILPLWAKSVIIFCIPYRSTTELSNDGFSEYARTYDYHKYSSALYDKILGTLSKLTQKQFKGFCDHSPINEKLAAAKCGLGLIGRNSLFIDEVYGSFVFLGSIVTDIVIEFSPNLIKECENCGICALKCPNHAIINQGIDRNKCLSGISQKKSKNEEEKMLLKQHNIVWGCDICQNVCPHNAKAKVSPIPYFANTRKKHIDKDFILSLSDDEFNKYAFAYKGRKLVLDNIDFK